MRLKRCNRSCLSCSLHQHPLKITTPVKRVGNKYPPQGWFATVTRAQTYWELANGMTSAMGKRRSGANKYKASAARGRCRGRDRIDVIIVDIEVVKPILIIPKETE
jgi:hypothetical protein